MGITFSAIQKLKSMDVLSSSGIDILDIGSSNLYSATIEGILEFVHSFDEHDSEEDLKTFAKRMAQGSAYDPVSGGRNETFIGELFEACGISYRSFDIAKGYKTEIIDLNINNLPRHHYNAYDIVLNFGTTEHILNQFNCFKVIHEACKPGGYMVHQLPISGFTDHGYFVYTGRNLFDLAKFNHYEIVNLWFDGPAGDDDVYQSVQSYKSTFPVLAKLDLPDDIRIPNHAITIIFKKMRDLPFAGMLETTTSVGKIPGAVHDSYGSSISSRLGITIKRSKYLRLNLGIMQMLERILRPNK